MNYLEQDYILSSSDRLIRFWEESIGAIQIWHTACPSCGEMMQTIVLGELERESWICSSCGWEEIRP